MADIIGNNIMNIMGQKGVSMRQLSRDLDLSYTVVFNLCKREDLSTTQLGTLKKVADYLEVSIEDLYIS